jgi:hypothetical protein
MQPNTIHLITFANKKPFTDSQIILNNTFKNAGIYSHTMWDQNKINITDFYANNKYIFERYKTIGYGLFIWKPYIILEKLKEIDENDFIYYQDSSRYDFSGFENNIQPICDYMDKNNIDLLPGFLINKFNKSLIKKECLKYMNVDNNDEFLNKFHYHTSPLIFKKNEKTFKFIEEWLQYCQIHECIIKNVAYHQCDQAIFNILLYKYNYNGLIETDDKQTSKSYKIYWKNLLEFVEKN